MVALIAMTVSAPSLGQKREGLPRNQNSGVANPIAPGVFEVVSVDTYGRIVQMRGPVGTVGVYVGEGIYDISKLKAGDRLQVNFLEPDGLSNKISAANIWPVKPSK